MRKGILIFGISLLAVSIGLALFLRPPMTRKLLEFGLNQASRELFAGTLRLEKVEWRSGPGIDLKNLHGQLQMPSGPVPLEVRSVESRGSLLDFFSRSGLRLNFEGAHPLGSPREGLAGAVWIRGGRNGFFELRSEARSVDLEDLVWVNPENLKGSQGEIKGEIAIRQNATGDLRIRGKLRIAEPGGKLPARFFDLIKPYLPVAVTSAKIKTIQAAGGLVGFRVARLEMEMENPEVMKLFLQLAVPDYNLDLHLKMEIRFRG